MEIITYFWSFIGLLLLHLAVPVKPQTIGDSGMTVGGLVGLIIGVIAATIIAVIIALIVMAACSGGGCKMRSRGRVTTVNNTSANATAVNNSSPSNYAGNSNYTNNSNTGNTIVVMVPPQGGQVQGQAQVYPVTQSQPQFQPQSYPPQYNDPAYPPPGYTK